MNKIKFWESWDTDIRYPYLFLALLAVIALLTGIFHYFEGEEITYAWDKITDLQVVPVPVQEVTRLLIPFTLSAEAYLVFEQYDVALAEVNTTAAIMVLGILSFCIAFYAASISTMRRYAYFAGILLLMLFLASFSLDLLGIAGSAPGQTMLLISIILYASISYGFQAFWQQTRFGLRLVVMLLITFLLGLVIFSGSELTMELTTLHLVSYSSVGILVASILFMVWVAYENVNVLLWINTQAATPERRFSMWQFLLISILYLANLLLLYLRHIGYVKLDLFYVNGYIILFLSALAGFWGMRQREAYYGKLFTFRPTGAVLYLVFATVTFLSIGYAFSNANDPHTALYHNLIVYTHLAYGFMFLLYVMINFGRLIEERKQVYKVVYDPKKLSLLSFFLMGTILLAILVVRTQYRLYYHAQAGYYNNLGDLYRASDNAVLAERFYLESNVYDASNVKANYSLASLYRMRDQRNNEIIRLQETLQKRPNPKMYVRLANLYDEKQYFFEKLYVLREGMKKFPENAELYNNTALLYMQTSALDSTDFYFKLAQEYTDNEDVIRSNRLAFYTRQAMLEPAEELLAESRKGKYKPLRTNMTVLRSLLGRDQERDDFAPDSLEQVEDFTLFYNQTLSSLNSGDTSRLKLIDRFLGSRSNQLFYEDLLFSKGLVHHYNGRPKEARNIVENLALTSIQRTGYYYNTLGIWMLEERNYQAAANYFDRARNNGFPEAFLSMGYALARAHKPRAAVAALGEVGFTENEEAIAAADDMAVILQQDVQTIITLASDSNKVQYLTAFLPRLKLEEVNALVQSVQEKDLRRQALLTRIDYLMVKEKWKLANEAIKDAADQLKPEDEFRSQLNLKQFWLWVYSKNYDVLLNRLDKLYLSDRDKRVKLYFRAKVAEVKNRDREAAERYQQAVDMLLYDERVVAEAAAFFSRYQPGEMTAYNILLDGIIYNPYSPLLQKAYAMESLNKGLPGYAEGALESLKGLLPASEYSTFIQEFEKRRKQLETQADNWQL